MCQRCGTDVSYIAEGAQRRVSELEQQVRILTDKATAAGKFAPSPNPLLLLFLFRKRKANPSTSRQISRL